MVLSGRGKRWGKMDRDKGKKSVRNSQENFKVLKVITVITVVISSSTYH